MSTSYVCLNPKKNTLKSIREENEESESESPSEIEEEDVEDEESSEEEDAEPVQTVRSYAALMQSLAAGSVPRAKRRKLGHNVESKASVEDEHRLKDEEGAEDADLVEEPEEGPETRTDGLVEEDEEPEDASDPFEAHFADPDENVLSQKLKAFQQNEWATQRAILPKVGKVVISTPQKDDIKSAAEPMSVSGYGELKLKQKLAGVMAKQRPSFDVLERSIAPLLFSYHDILYCDRSTANAENLRRLTCLHAVNHVFK